MRPRVLFAVIAAAFLLTSCASDEGPGPGEAAVAADMARNACLTLNGYTETNHESQDWQGVADTLDTATKWADEAAKGDPQWRGLADALGAMARTARHGAQAADPQPDGLALNALAPSVHDECLKVSAAG